MKIGNFIRILDRKATINKGRVRFSGWVIITVFSIAIIEKLLAHFEIFSLETHHTIETVTSIMICGILAQAIMVGIYRLSPRYRWETLTMMSLGIVVPLALVTWKKYSRGDAMEDIYMLSAALGVMVILGSIALWRWRYHIKRLQHLKFERQLEEQRRRRRKLYE